MRDPVRIVAAKEPYLSYRTRRLLPGDEFDAPRAIARIFVDKLGYATRAIQSQPRHVVAPHVPEGDNVAALHALAASLGIKVDGRWATKRLIAKIEKARS